MKDQIYFKKYPFLLENPNRCNYSKWHLQTVSQEFSVLVGREIIPSVLKRAKGDEVTSTETPSF